MSKRTDMFEKIRYEDDKKEERLTLLKEMTNEEIDLLIKNTPLVQGKIALSKFKKK